MTCNFVTVMCSYANLWVEASPRKCPLTRLRWSVSSARCLMSIKSCETVTEECDGVCSIGLFYWKTSLVHHQLQKRGSFPAVPLTMVCRRADFVIGETCDLRVCARGRCYVYTCFPAHFHHCNGIHVIGMMRKCLCSAPPLTSWSARPSDTSSRAQKRSVSPPPLTATCR